MTTEQRSYCMSKVKGSGTSLERIVRSELYKQGFRFRKNLKTLLGKPDIVFQKAKVAVFIDGDFWHGYQFQDWQGKLTDSWKKKIADNIERDKRNHQKLHEMGWNVIQLWEHDIKAGLNDCLYRIIQAIEESRNKT